MFTINLLNLIQKPWKQVLFMSLVFLVIDQLKKGPCTRMFIFFQLSIYTKPTVFPTILQNKRNQNENIKFESFC